MTALEIILIVTAAALATALILTSRARKRERYLCEVDKSLARADSFQELAQTRAARRQAEAELHEARLQIVALELRRNALEADMAEEAGRLGLFRRSSSEIPPEETGRERVRTSRGGA